MDLSIVIPVFQAEQSIESVVNELFEDPNLKALQWELVMVDDFSQDRSWNIINRLSKEHNNLLGICLHKNCGQHTATFVGLKEAKGKYLLTLDDDGEHPIKEIPKMIEEIEKHSADVVYASPKKREKSKLRVILSQVFKASARLFSDGYGNGSSFRLIEKSIYSQIQKHRTPFVFIDEILAWYTKNVVFLPMEFRKAQKVSTYKPKRLLSLFSDIMYTYSSFPAQFLTRVGFGGSIISLGFGVFFIIKKLFFKAQLGFTSIAVSILFSASIILLGLGIIAQYIYRQNRLLNEYPQYSIKHRTDE
jgi:undecaprenyl-phosphate 4-deoxy-4-formamido-L-arabinose transferase